MTTNTQRWRVRTAPHHGRSNSKIVIMASPPVAEGVYRSLESSIQRPRLKTSTYTSGKGGRTYFQLAEYFEGGLSPRRAFNKIVSKMRSLGLDVVEKVQSSKPHKVILPIFNDEVLRGIVEAPERSGISRGRRSSAFRAKADQEEARLRSRCENYARSIHKHIFAWDNDGNPDSLIMNIGGQIELAVEYKSTKGRPERHQAERILFLRNVMKLPVHVVNSFEQFKSLFSETR